MKFITPLLSDTAQKGLCTLDRPTFETIRFHFYLSNVNEKTSALYGIEWDTVACETYLDDEASIEDDNKIQLLDYLEQGLEKNIRVQCYTENNVYHCTVSFDIAVLRIEDLSLTLSEIHRPLSPIVFDSLWFAYESMQSNSKMDMGTVTNTATEQPEEESEEEPMMKKRKLERRFGGSCGGGGVSIFPKMKKPMRHKKSKPIQGVVTPIQTHTFYKKPNGTISVTEFIKTLFESEPDNVYRNGAAVLGTKLHKEIELFLQYGKRPIHQSLEFSHFLEFLKDHSHLTPYRIEWRLTDTAGGWTGGIDALMRDDHGAYYLYDWKRVSTITYTSSKKSIVPEWKHLDDCNYVKYALQLNMYSALLRKIEHIEVREMAIVQLHPSQRKYQKINVTTMADVCNLIC
jgi:hypothetical protein